MFTIKVSFWSEMICIPIELRLLFLPMKLLFFSLVDEGSTRTGQSIRGDITDEMSKMTYFLPFNPLRSLKISTLRKYFVYNSIRIDSAFTPNKCYYFLYWRLKSIWTLYLILDQYTWIARAKQHMWNVSCGLWTTRNAFLDHYWLKSRIIFIVIL